METQTSGTREIKMKIKKNEGSQAFITEAITRCRNEMRTEPSRLPRYKKKVPNRAKRDHTERGKVRGDPGYREYSTDDALERPQNMMNLWVRKHRICDKQN